MASRCRLEPRTDLIPRGPRPEASRLVTSRAVDCLTIGVRVSFEFEFEFELVFVCESVSVFVSVFVFVFVFEGGERERVRFAETVPVCAGCVQTGYMGDVSGRPRAWDEGALPPFAAPSQAEPPVAPRRD